MVVVSRHSSKNRISAELGVLSVAAFTAFSLSLLAQTPVQAQASRFAHAQKTIVPASQFSRRFDDDSVTDSNSADDEAAWKKTGLATPPHPKTSTGSAGASATAAKGNWTKTPSAAADHSVLARAQAKVQPLLAAGKYDTAQQLMDTYVRSYPHDKSLRQELSKIAVKNAQQLLPVSAQGSASAARTALNADSTNLSARTVLDQALTKMGATPSDPAERIKLGDALIAQGRPSEAVVEYQESLRLKPSADAHIGLGNAQWHEGKKDSARIEFQRALSVNPKSETALRQLGILDYQEKEVVSANADLGKALMINPGDKTAGHYLVELWQQQVTHSPNSANSHMGLARAFQLSGDLRNAQSEYRQVVRLDPQNPNLPQARKSFKVALARQQAQQLYETGRDLETHGQIIEAHQKLQEAATLYPVSVPIQLYRGQLSQRLAQYSEAQNAYQAVLRLFPKNSAAIAGLNSLSAQGQAPLVAQQAPSYAPAPAQYSSPGTTSYEAPAANAAPNPVPLSGSVAPPPGAQLPINTNVQPMDQVPNDPSKIATSSHVGTMSSFMSQLRDLTTAAQQQYDSINPSLGSTSLSGGSTLSTASLPTVQGLAAAPTPVDTSGVGGVLSQAASALRSAGITPTAASAAPAAAAAQPAPGGFMGLTSQALGVTTNAAATPMENYVGMAAQALNGKSTTLSAAKSATAANLPNISPELISMAVSVLQPMGPSVNAATLGSMAQRARPLLQKSDGSLMSNGELNLLYKRNRSKIEKQLGYRLPSSLGFGGAAVASAAAPYSTQAPAAPYASQFAQAENFAGAENEFAPPMVMPNAMPSAVAPQSSFQPAPNSFQPQTAPPQTSFQPQSSQLPPYVSQSSFSAAGVTASPALPPAAPQVVPVNSSVSNAPAISMAAPIASASPAAAPTAGALPVEQALRGPIEKQVSGTESAKAPTNDPLRGFIPPGGASTSQIVSHRDISLELLGVQPSANEVKLKVLLKNAQNVSLKIPSGTKAVVMLNGKQRTGKVSFPSGSVPPGGQIEGTIKLAGNDLDPASELWIPNVLPGSGADRNLHLTVNVPMSPM